MKKIRKYWHVARHSLAKIHLVDKFLILFMIVLMLQSAYSLFMNHLLPSDMDHIDVVIRTSMAAVFGYILSANFIRHPSSDSGKSVSGKAASLTLEGRGSSIQSRIGFSDSTTTIDPVESGNVIFQEDAGKEVSPPNRLQIIVAASIGLFCLVVLIILRNLSGQILGTVVESASAAATVTQFRDFVSGCIGFLIGSPTSTNNLN